MAQLEYWSLWNVVTDNFFSAASIGLRTSTWPCRYLEKHLKIVKALICKNLNWGQLGAQNLLFYKSLILDKYDTNTLLKTKKMYLFYTENLHLCII